VVLQTCDEACVSQTGCAWRNMRGALVDLEGRGVKYETVTIGPTSVFPLCFHYKLAHRGITTQRYDGELLPNGVSY